MQSRIGGSSIRMPSRGLRGIVTSMSEDARGRIRGKVAAILSKRELILNVGSDDGVEIGMKFVILNSQGIDVSDPDTGKVLGTVEVPKTVVKVVRVDDVHL